VQLPQFVLTVPPPLFRVYDPDDEHAVTPTAAAPAPASARKSTSSSPLNTDDESSDSSSDDSIESGQVEIPIVPPNLQDDSPARIVPGPRQTAAALEVAFGANANANAAGYPQSPTMLALFANEFEAFEQLRKMQVISTQAYELAEHENHNYLTMLLWAATTAENPAERARILELVNEMLRESNVRSFLHNDAQKAYAMWCAIEAGHEFVGALLFAGLPPVVRLPQPTWSAEPAAFAAHEKYNPLTDITASLAYDPEAIHVAIVRGDLNTLEKLVNAGADVNSFFGKTKDKSRKTLTPLMLAVAMNDANKVEFLLNANADPLIPNWLNWTPLHIAAFVGNLAIVQLLANAGAVNTIVMCAIPPNPYSGDAQAIARENKHHALARWIGEHLPLVEIGIDLPDDLIIPDIHALQPKLPVPPPLVPPPAIPPPAIPRPVPHNVVRNQPQPQPQPDPNAPRTRLFDTYHVAMPAKPARKSSLFSRVFKKK
jgi:hypothetical protein